MIRVAHERKFKTQFSFIEMQTFNLVWFEPAHQRKKKTLSYISALNLIEERIRLIKSWELDSLFGFLIEFGS